VIDFHTATSREPRTEHTFIRTYTGRRFWPLNPKADEVCIEDIAHALSLACRFSGHTYCFYSVADHSLRVSKCAEQIALKAWEPDADNPASNRAGFAREMALWGLLHDASEAFLCDLPSPLKRSAAMGQLYKRYERTLMQTIAERFNLIPHEPALVKKADSILLDTEMRDLMDVPRGAEKIWQCGDDCLRGTIYPLDPWHAEQEFLRRFHALDMARKAAAASAGIDPVEHNLQIEQRIAEAIAASMRKVVNL